MGQHDQQSILIRDSLSHESMCAAKIQEYVLSTNVVRLLLYLRKGVGTTRAPSRNIVNSLTHLTFEEDSCSIWNTIL